MTQTRRNSSGDTGFEPPQLQGKGAGFSKPAGPTHSLDTWDMAGSGPSSSQPRRLPLSGNGLRGLVQEFRLVSALSASRAQASRNASVVDNFLQVERIRRAGDITAPVIQSYLVALLEAGRSQKTLINHAGSLSRFCDFLIGKGLLKVNPCRLVKLRRPEKIAPRYLNDREYRKALCVAYKHHSFCEVALALYTGLRRDELRRLEWQDVEWDARKLLVRRTKSRRPRVVPLSRKALMVFRHQRRRTGRLKNVFPARRTWGWKGGAGWKWQDKARHNCWWERAIRPLQEAIPKFRSLPGCSTGRGWHLFRHTFASRAVQAGVSIYKVAQWLGHSDVRCTQLYAHLEPGYDEEIDKV